MKSIALSLLIVVTGIIGCNQATPPAGTMQTAQKPQLPASTQVETNEVAANNEGDRSSTVSTPVAPDENQKDADITASIREKLVDRKLSSNAQSSKITTRDGKVTLHGLVQTEEEKHLIEKIAVDVAGDGNVWNELQVQQ